VSGYTRTDAGPASKYAAVTPNNSLDIPGINIKAGTRGIAFKTAGDIVAVRPDGETVTIPSGVLAAGSIHPICVVRIKATGTTAADIWAFWD